MMTVDQVPADLLRVADMLHLSIDVERRPEGVRVVTLSGRQG
jgi:hypothetical protein